MIFHRPAFYPHYKGVNTLQRWLARGRNNMAWTKLKMVVLPPTPSASVSPATAAKPGSSVALGHHRDNPGTGFPTTLLRAAPGRPP